MHLILFGKGEEVGGQLEDLVVGEGQGCVDEVGKPRCGECIVKVFAEFEEVCGGWRGG